LVTGNLPSHAAQPSNELEKRDDERIEQLAALRRPNVSDAIGWNPQRQRPVSRLVGRQHADVVPGFVKALCEMSDANGPDDIRWRKPGGDQQHLQGPALRNAVLGGGNTVEFVHIISQVGTSTMA